LVNQSREKVSATKTCGLQRQIYRMRGPLRAKLLFTYSVHESMENAHPNPKIAQRISAIHCGANFSYRHFKDHQRGGRMREYTAARYSVQCGPCTTIAKTRPIRTLNTHAYARREIGLFFLRTSFTAGKSSSVPLEMWQATNLRITPTCNTANMGTESIRQALGPIS